MIDKHRPTIVFVGIFQYLWIYQKPKVLMVDVIACARPRYVFCKKLNWNLSFWQIDIKVPVVFKPYHHPWNQGSEIRINNLHPLGGRMRKGIWKCRVTFCTASLRSRSDGKWICRLNIPCYRVLAHLFPSDGEITLAFGEWRSGAWLLKNDYEWRKLGTDKMKEIRRHTPPNAKKYPICVGTVMNRGCLVVRTHST